MLKRLAQVFRKVVHHPTADSSARTRACQLRCMAKDLDVVLKRFDRPDETRVVDEGRFDLVHLGVSLHFLRAREYAKAKR